MTGEPIVIGRHDRRYEIGNVISQGGMGTVHLGRHLGPLGFAKQVAIKSLRSDHAANATVREMFIDEARLTARLNHANIASTLDIVVDDQAVYIVMEYIDGRALADLCKAARLIGRRIPVDVACAIAHDVLVGLDHAHDAHDEQLGALGIVHCDVSPQNVRVGADGLTRILDFGIARATDTLTTSTRVAKLHGKIPYMAPEQIQAAKVDRRTDVYGVGVILWEMLVGSRLFQAATPVTLASEILTGHVPRPSEAVKGLRLPTELEAVVMKALSRDPRDRFETARAMAEQLAKAASIATRARVADVLHDLRPSEYTPVSGIRALATATPRPRSRAQKTTSSFLSMLIPFAPTRTNIISALLAVAALGLLGVALGAAVRRASVSAATASAAPPGRLSSATAAQDPLPVVPVPVPIPAVSAERASDTAAMAPPTPRRGKSGAKGRGRR